jgi:hypothetical protein
LTGVTAAGLAGTIDTNQGQSIDIIGAQASGSAGTVGVGISLALTGGYAAGQVGNLFPIYWKPVDDSQNADWQNINDAQAAAWQVISNAQSSSSV